MLSVALFVLVSIRLSNFTGGGWRLLLLPVVVVVVGLVPCVMLLDLLVAVVAVVALLLLLLLFLLLFLLLCLPLYHRLSPWSSLPPCSCHCHHCHLSPSSSIRVVAREFIKCINKFIPRFNVWVLQVLINHLANWNHKGMLAFEISESNYLHRRWGSPVYTLALDL
jgi:fumarate reductase subunit D